MEIRYYADAEVAEWHEHILRLLEEIDSEHGIPVTIDRVEARFGPITDFPGIVRDVTAQTVYERDLRANEDLAATIDRTPSKVYRSGGKYDIAGHIALIDDGVKWASTLHGDAYGHGPGAEDFTPIDFLGEVARSPCNRFCAECVHLLDGDENYCPNCGYELS